MLSHSDVAFLITGVSDHNLLFTAPAETYVSDANSQRKPLSEAEKAHIEMMRTVTAEPVGNASGAERDVVDDEYSAGVGAGAGKPLKRGKVGCHFLIREIKGVLVLYPC